MNWLDLVLWVYTHMTNCKRIYYGTMYEISFKAEPKISGSEACITTYPNINSGQNGFDCGR